MADRYQDRAYGAGHGRGGDQHGSERGENDPLAELARLIGQTDSFGKAGGQASQRPAPPRQEVRQDYYNEDEYEQPAPEPEAPRAPAGPPSWIQRANIRREPPQEAPREIARDFQRELPRNVPRGLPPEPAPQDLDYPSAVHPLHRYAPQPQPQAYQPPHPDSYYEEQPAYQQPAAHQHEPQAYAEAGQELDPSRYDDALYGQLENGMQDFQREPAYPDDPYAYQGEYDEEMEEPPKKRRGVPPMVLAILGLGVFGFAAAYGYHSYFGAPRSGDIPIIKADNSPTKIVPQQSDATAKVPDRMVTGDGTEKIVPREEQPVDVNSRNVAPRVVFPPLNQNANPPSVASVATTAMPPAPAVPVAPGPGGTLPNSEPRKIKTFSVKGDQPDPSAVPVNTPQPAAPPSAAAAKNAKLAKTSPTNANASANAPLSLSPQGPSTAPADSGTQIASTNPTQTAPTQTAPSAAEGESGYMVQISSQKSEADAMASFKSMQSKFPAVLGSQTPVIRRHDAGAKGVYYRAMVGPFASKAEATQFCSNYQSAGGQCYTLKN